MSVSCSSLGGGISLKIDLKKESAFSASTCLPEGCRNRSTGVDSGRSWSFSTGAGPGVDIFNWNRTRSRSDF